MTISAREMQPQEMRVVWDMFISLAQEQDAVQYLEGSFEQFEKEMSRADTSDTILVALDKDVLVGFVSYCCLFSFYKTNPFVYMRTLYVKPDARRKKVGQALVGKVAEKALTLGAHGLSWDIFAHNDKAASFYKGLDLREDDQELVYYWADEDEMKGLIER